MARCKTGKSETPDFRITNTNMKLKREIICIAASEGKTYSQFIREQLIKIRNSYPEQARKYSLEEDDGN